MANMHEYLRWRGDLSYVERTFNNVDNLVLATLSYLDFTGIVPDERSDTGVSLARACQRLLKKAGSDLAPYVRSLAQVDSSFVQLVASSKRFGGATLRNYVDVVDESRALQFSGVQIDLEDGPTYVAFRGTDNTLVGWREDFMMSFCVIEAQHEAQAYLERCVRRAAERGTQVLVGGHSKGGNLAEYAATCCADDLRERIAKVYSNDGPGMAPEVMSHDSATVLGKRLVRIVPSYSVVGMLFARPGDQRTIVRSSGTGIGQHDPTTWQVTYEGMQEASGLQPECVVLNEAIARWAKSLSLDERARVTDELFDALEAGGATRLDEIASSREGLQQVLSALGNTDERTRDVVLALVQGTVDGSVDAVRRATQDAIERWSRGARGAAAEATRLLQGTGGEIRVPVSALRRSPSRGR